MSLLGRLFGDGDSIKKTASGIYDGLDKIVFTNEEKSEHFLKLLKHYEPYKLAQRLIATAITLVFLLNMTTAGVLLVVAMSTNSPDLLNGAKTLAKINTENLAIPFSLVVGFYFGGGALEGIIHAGRAKK